MGPCDLAPRLLAGLGASSCCPRLSFRNCLTLVLDRSSDESKRTIKFCVIRNQIVHGYLRHADINLQESGGRQVGKPLEISRIVTESVFGPH